MGKNGYTLFWIMFVGYQLSDPLDITAGVSRGNILGSNILSCFINIELFPSAFRHCLKYAM